MSNISDGTVNLNDCRDATYADISSELCVVEVNTWILTARRHWKGPLVSPLLEGLFYLTWVLIRNVFYPYKVRFRNPSHPGVCTVCMKECSMYCM